MWWWGLVYRVAKWSAFIALFTIATSPKLHEVPDPTHLCVQGHVCERVIEKGNR